MAIPEQRKKKKTKNKLPDQREEVEKKEDNLSKAKKKKKELPGEDDAGREEIDGRKKKKQKLQQRQSQEGDIADKSFGAKKLKKKSGRRDAHQSGMEGKMNGGQKNLITDDRFASAHSDPRFQRMPQREVKVSIDSRFSRLFSDKSYASSSAPVDKRGKPRKRKGEHLLSQYYLREEEKPAEAKGSADLEDDSEPSTADEEHVDASDIDSDTSSSTEDEEDDADYQDEDESDGWKLWMVNQEEAPIIEEETHRLAVVNLDWDHIRAVDIYVMMSTTLLTCPQSGGQVLSVSIYPSEFGIKCMEIEAVRGPHALINADDADDDNDEDDDETVNEKIRSYQLQRLKYYYAVVECDSSVTANHLYNALDGVEFLRSANVLDLRFIPDSMDFQHSPRDVATEVPSDYKQPDFETTALQHSSVKLTWDDDEPERKKILRRRFNPDQMDELEQYLASEDSEEEQEEEEQDKYQALLHDDASGSDDDDHDDDDGKKEMEVTFLPGVENLSKHIEKSRLKKSEESVWSAALRKRREKNKARKNMYDDDGDDDDDDNDDDKRELPDDDDGDDFFVEEGEKMAVTPKDRRRGSRKLVTAAKDEATEAELELLLANEGAEGEHLKGFNLRPKKKKNKNKKEMPVAVDKLPEVDAVADPRFLSRLSSGLYSLDPTDPQFKRSAVGMRQEQSRKQGKKMDHKVFASVGEEVEGSLPAVQEKPSKDKHEIMSLVRSLKLKSQVLGENAQKKWRPS